MPKANKDINNRNLLLKIRSKYILKQIFENMQHIRKLKIVNYNKNLKKSLEVELNDYKIEFSKIEIEIIPAEYKYTKFINILNKNNEPYFHIYFNDQKVEAKTNRITREQAYHDDLKVHKIKVIIDHKIKSLFQLFKGCRCIKKINFIKFNRTDIKNFSRMFEDCSSLQELDISKLKIENATDMSYMFSECALLKELNLSNFKDNKVTNLSVMFHKCSSLSKINLANFVTKNVEKMNSMFEACSSLLELNKSLMFMLCLINVPL